MPIAESYWVNMVGDTVDMESGRLSVHYIEKTNGEKIMPVFSTQEKAHAFLERFIVPDLQAHMSMLESVPTSHVAPLTAGRFSTTVVPVEFIVNYALGSDMDYVQLNPGPDEPAKVMALK
jgi:hypothetical protein